MLRIDMGQSGRYCDGLSRRHFVRLGVAGMASVGLPRVLEARELSGKRKQTSVILIWLDGGPSHMDLYDLKPEAPPEYRGIWKPITTNVEGMSISELFPKQARIADKFSVVRSLHHDNGDHFSGAHAMLTSRISGVNGAATAGRSPSIGAIAARLRGSNAGGMPPYVSIPSASSIGLTPGYFDASYLGSRYQPFQTGGDPNERAFQVNNLALIGNATLDALEDRRGLLTRLDSMRRRVDASGAMETMDRFQLDAYQMVSGPAARKAFDLSSEDPRLRDRYGRHTWGQSCLLARRLVEAGVTFVTVHMGGWDNHWDLKGAMESYLPKVDAGISSLLTDLEARGRLDSTLVVMCGEFSRTPRMNNGGNGGPPLSKGTPGRDHWGSAMFCFFAGGGLKMGQMVGSTDKLGETPKDRPYTPANVHATIYHVLGIDPSQQFLDHAGRPVPILDDREPIRELI